MIKDKVMRLIASFLAAILGGIVFQLLHLPIPWLLGSMTFVLIGSRLFKIEFYWPRYIREAGLIIVGYEMGLSFTKETLIEVGNKLPSMLFTTVLIILFSSGAAWIISKFTKVDYPSVLLGSIPGGLSQMIVMAEEEKGIDLTIVTFLQVARLMMIIFIVPVLVVGPFFGGEKSAVVEASSPLWSDLSSKVLLFFILSIGFAFLGKRIHMPTPFLLGPIIVTASLNISGVNGPLLPHGLLDLSQLFIGGYIGLMMKPEKLENKTKMITLALISSFSLILCALGLSVGLMTYYHFSIPTSFLALAPGGMEQMALMAHEIRADLSIVTAYQLFRIFFILFIVPPVLKWLFKTQMNKKLRIKQKATE